MKSYRVAVTKSDGAESTYVVLALSAGGAENACLEQVYNAKYALATEINPEENYRYFDLFSRGAARESVLARYSTSPRIAKAKGKK